MTDFLLPANPVMDVSLPEPLALNQWVLRIAEPPRYALSPLNQAAKVLTAMQQLVEIIQVVRSPAGGWDAHRPATPENLLPYVTEEACDLLDNLEVALDSLSRQPAAGVESWLSQNLWQNYCLAEDFAPQLLWGIARSAYEVMRLLEGVRVQVNMEGRSQTGTVRLATLLHIQIADHSQTFDLVTHHPPLQTLGDDISIQLLEGCPMAEPQPAGEVLQQFVQQIRMSTPAILSFLEGIAVTALTPNHPWQHGTLQLLMKLAFVSDEVQGVTLAENGLKPAALPPKNTPLVLKFTDTVWLEAYRTTVIQQCLATLIPQLPAYENMTHADLPPLTNEILPLLVQNACEVADLLQHSPPFLTQRSALSGVALDDLLPWLLWCLSRSAYEVMHLVGGLRCRLLQPEQDWQWGLLRLLLTLKVSTPERDWYFDLATGQMPEPDVFPLSPDVVVQTPGELWTQQPCLIEQLQNRVMTRIETVTPELRLLLDGTAVDLLEPQTEATPALAKLLIDFDFLADLHLG